jgi:hypothetical protein
MSILTIYERCRSVVEEEGEEDAVERVREGMKVFEVNHETSIV